MLLTLRIAALAGAMALCASASQAAVTYRFTLDTSSIAGTDGFLEMQFANGGAFGVAQEATATISHFQGGTFTEADPYSASDLFGVPNVAGHVSGVLPGVLSMGEVTQVLIDDYLQGFKFGNSLSFDVTLSGPAVDASACKGGSCSLPGFSFDALNADGSQFLLTGDPDGATPLNWLLGQVEVNADGGTTPIVYAGPNGAPLLSIAAVPEPASWALMLMGFGGLGAVLRHRRATPLLAN